MDGVNMSGKDEISLGKSKSNRHLHMQCSSITADTSSTAPNNYDASSSSSEDEESRRHSMPYSEQGMLTNVKDMKCC